MRRVTNDTLHVTGGGDKTFSQNVSSLALTVWEIRFVEDIFTKDDSLTQFIIQYRSCL